jgi:flavin-dependent dehydrogenase
MQIEHVDVLIVGAGPAGLSTALHLLHQDNSFTDRIIVIEKAKHPREKLCAGGVSGHAAGVLSKLNCKLDVPHISVEHAILSYKDRQIIAGGGPAFRVTNRREFDDWLYRVATNRGVSIRQGEALKDIQIKDGLVRVSTSRQDYTCRVLIAADGTNGITRRKAGFSSVGGTARLLEVRTPEDPARSVHFRDQQATFDFSLLAGGLQGYYWEFPSVVDGEPMMNHGVFECAAPASHIRTDLKRTLQQKMAEKGKHLDDFELKGFGLHQFHWRNPMSSSNVLLVGDAAGVDPLLGEGIPCALAYGDIAAQSVIDAFRRNDFSFRSYKRNLFVSPIGRLMLVRALIAYLLYRNWGQATLATLAKCLSWFQRNRSAIATTEQSTPVQAK